MTRLPPLNALVAFRAVMEAGSLVAAAQKLSITASAVSHRLKALEDHLGLELFERRSRAVFPTPAAYRYASEISVAFDRIAMATRTIESVGNRDTLAIHCMESLACSWLLPRLKKFSEINSEITVTVACLGDSMTDGDGHYDFDFVRTDRVPDGFGSLPFGREKFRPLIAPEMLERIGYPKKPEELLKLPLIRSTGCSLGWQEWLDQAGVTNPVVDETYSFRSAHVALDGAVRGLGIALESSLLSAHLEHDRKLVPLFPEYQVSGVGHKMLWQIKRGDEPKMRLFRTWIEGELANSVTRYPSAYDSSLTALNRTVTEPA
ncbi:LysR family transcriptional regulator [Rhodobacteraceae bacterium RKSG542]|uniref:LysR substrate-binding domain-containing protein n=1 Tax=Pseudovibrio flavus TaxID=2529854 RepID=UPI0012BBE4A8|nr:LysR substrate-binding domain-containing protein [Pseudovibrio flavus]MTI16797.1 LysR family transcriptional regulator [Pseudovibrio flavus]